MAFNVLLRVHSQEVLSTVLGCLGSAATLGRVEETDEPVPVPPTPAPAPPAAKPKPRYLNGIKNKGISSAALALEVVSSEPRVWPEAEVGRKYAARGFAASSASSALCAHVKAGRMKRVGPKRYCMAEAAKPAPATLFNGRGNGSHDHA